MATVFALLIAFQVKHFLADYPLQTRWMLGKFKREPNEWVPPLTAHAFAHASLTAVIVGVASALLGKSVWLAWTLAIGDFVVHFIVDRIKASPDLLGRWKPDQPAFWWALGGDQMAHHLTHYAIIWALVSS